MFDTSGSDCFADLRAQVVRNLVFLTKREGKKRFQSGIDTEGVARGTIPDGNEV